MKFKLLLILFFLSFFAFGQSKTNTYEFVFYKNGTIKRTNKLEFIIVCNSDTIKHKITNNKIVLPKELDKCDIIIRYKKKIYSIKNVNFSEISNGSKIICGTEKNTNTFIPLLNRHPEAKRKLGDFALKQYFFGNTSILITIDNLNLAKRVNFIVIKSSTISKEGNLKVQNYSKSEIE